VDTGKGAEITDVSPILLIEQVTPEIKIMKTLHTACCSVIALMVLSLSSCKKENPDAVQVPGPPAPPTTSQVASVQLNGGNVIGRWTMAFEQYVTFRNDTLQDFDTATYPPGIFIAQFTSNQLMIIDGLDTTLYPYTISGNQMTVDDGGDDIIFSYGISSQGTMRWSMSSTYSSGNNLYRYYDDYLFERY
jgi:hypothetical protein